MNARVKLLFALLLLFCSCRVVAQGESMEGMLEKLDDVIANRSEIFKTKESKITSLKLLLNKALPSARLDLTEAIFNEYHGYRTDSALTYAKQVYLLSSDPMYGSPVRHQKAQIELAKCYSIYGDYTLAEKTLAELSSTILPQNKALYYDAMVLLYIWRSDYSRDNEARNAYYSHVHALRDSVAKYETDPFLRIQQQSINLMETDVNQAKNQLRATMTKIAGKDEYLRYISNSLATCYKYLGVADSARYYYALSALADMRSGIQEHSSLRELALLLFDAGDVAHAYKYTNCCLEDARQCGAQLRMLQLAEDMPRIMETYHTLVSKQKKGLSIVIVLLVVVFMFLAAFTFYLYRLTKNLHRARGQLLEVNLQLKESQQQLQSSLEETSKANAHLQEANRIKESFVAQYMKQCAQSLELVESYRHSILKLAMGGANPNKLLTALRDNSLTEKEYRQFMHNFDESFLRLFPTFIEEFNSLLLPEERIILPDGKLMNTELRIYALIRLGITESEDIGNFIGKSLKTVYNYRARIRNKALGPRDDFDHQVQALCKL